MKTIKRTTKFSIAIPFFLALISCRSEKVETVQSLTQNKEAVSAITPTPVALPKAVSLKLASGEELKVRLAISIEEQTQGLSGLKDADFQNDEAMLFFYTEDSDRMFWMPDTYFNLEIYFLDKDLTILAVERDVPFHPTRNVPPKIPTTKVHYCRHVLEIKSSSPLAKKIKPGDKLSWTGVPTLWEIEAGIRSRQ
ncbi:MAG: DUF192 domain-containing protein [Bacteriovoracaceae bacterium]